MLNLLEGFVDHQCQVTFMSAASESIHAFDLATMGITAKAIQLNHDSFNQVIADIQPDIVIFDRFMIEEQFGWRVRQTCPAAMCVLNTEDLHALRDARHQQIKHPSHELNTSSELFLREIASVLRCDLTLLVSTTEQKFLVERFPFTASLLHVYPLIPNLNQSALPSFLQRQDFVFIGNFRHAPNWDAVLKLKQLWPLIRKQTPGAELHVYGAYPPPKATQLHSPKTGFHIDGWADDVNRVMQNARLCIAPLRFGAGVKGKFLDAFQSGTPCVTTQVGIEGICKPEDWPGVVSDDDKIFCQSAAALYQDETQWQLAHEKCASLSKSSGDLNQQNQALISKIKGLHAALEQHRGTNFIGAMLRHHHHASTQYMSQWIASKTELKDLKNRLDDDLASE